LGGGVGVSIRATRALSVRIREMQVSIRAPRAGRDHLLPESRSWAWTFQSARPARGATAAGMAYVSGAFVFQSARPARGATPNCGTITGATQVSIRAPRAGRDGAATAAKTTGFMFQSARPARGATVARALHEQLEHVSIRAPRAGRDDLAGCPFGRLRGFNPRAPRGARPLRPGHDQGGAMFQSARPARGATQGRQ